MAKDDIVATTDEPVEENLIIDSSGGPLSDLDEPALDELRVAWIVSFNSSERKHPAHNICRVANEAMQGWHLVQGCRVNFVDCLCGRMTR